MKFASLASLVTVASLVTLAAVAGPAAAAPLGHHPKPKPKAAPVAQVSGNRLASGLLPASAFGTGFTAAPAITTGGSLQRMAPLYSVAKMSCGDFEVGPVPGVFGETGAASEDFNNPTLGTYPNTIMDGTEYAGQFASQKAAAAFYGQALAKYKSCTDFNDSVPGDTTSESSIQTLSVQDASTRAYKAFTVSQTITFAEIPGQSSYQEVEVALSGTDVFRIFFFSQSTEAITQMGQLVSRVQALYPRH